MRLNTLRLFVRGVSVIKKLPALRSRLDSRGVTITELLVILPVVTILIVFLVGILFSQYGSVLAEAKRSSLRAEAQAIMTGIQDEFLFSISYGEALDPLLADNFAPSGGWAFDTDPSTLIIYEIALDSNRQDEDRNIVRRRVTDCVTSPINSNPFAANNIVYFVEDDSGSNYDRLMKRSIAPTYALCSIDRTTGNPCVPATSVCQDNYRTTSCPAAEVSGDPDCFREDIVLTENVIDFDIQYFQEGNVATSSASSADQLEMTLVLGDVVFGRDVEVEVKHRIRKIN